MDETDRKRDLLIVHALGSLHRWGWVQVAIRSQELDPGLLHSVDTEVPSHHVLPPKVSINWKWESETPRYQLPNMKSN